REAPPCPAPGEPRNRPPQFPPAAAALEGCGIEPEWTSIQRHPRSSRRRPCMSTAALNVNAVSRPAVNPWLVATAVVIPTFMEILDTTIATASMRYIAGGLSATMNDSDWVMTSYLAANATILPITGWLSAHLGRRRYFLLSIAVFT